jgi:hypothetical protein
MQYMLLIYENERACEGEATDAYRAALAHSPAPAERFYLERRLAGLG